MSEVAAVRIILSIGPAVGSSGPVGSVSSAAQVLGPATPSATSPLCRWNCFSAASVAAPKMPSASTCNLVCSSLTKSPRSPRCSVGRSPMVGLLIFWGLQEDFCTNIGVDHQLLRSGVDPDGRQVAIIAADLARVLEAIRGQ